MACPGLDPTWGNLRAVDPVYPSSYTHPMSGKRILVDGYNVIRRIPKWADLFRRDMAASRNALIQHCTLFKSRHHAVGEIVVIFDGDSTVTSHPGPHVPGVRVTFTPTGVEADERIVEMVRGGAPHGMIVVSDDAEVAGRSHNLGATIMSVADFQRGALPGPGGARRKPKQTDEKKDLTPSQERAINEEMKGLFGIE